MPPKSAKAAAVPKKRPRIAAPSDFQAAAGVSRETVARLEVYAAELVRWQATINLVGENTLASLWQRHMLDSTQLLRLLPDASTPLVDLGSGAGFPGLVLAIAGVADVHLIEADGRKAAFLTEVARLTETEITVHNQRIEHVSPLVAGVVTARALAPLPELLAHAARFSGPFTTCLFHKGRDWRRELTLAREAWTMDTRCEPSIADPESVIMRVENLRPARPDARVG
ncbi:MAG: 16S rRNA (guanine(527)-N(7))-methyltransferase RsmG [Proteobacteria bacterium]|nr:16S rRNA (guanine(527)-N(7))-methyltransferase RsmG [Pseudomonadota bacterium]